MLLSCQRGQVDTCTDIRPLGPGTSLAHDECCAWLPCPSTLTSPQACHYTAIASAFIANYHFINRTLCSPLRCSVQVIPLAPQLPIASSAQLLSRQYRRRLRAPLSSYSTPAQHRQHVQGREKRKKCDQGLLAGRSQGSQWYGAMALIVLLLPLTCIATSNDPWGPVGSDMAEIAQITFNKWDTSATTFRKLY